MASGQDIRISRRSQWKASGGRAENPANLCFAPVDAIIKNWHCWRKKEKIFLRILTGIRIIWLTLSEYKFARIAKIKVKQLISEHWETPWGSYLKKLNPPPRLKGRFPRVGNALGEIGFPSPILGAVPRSSSTVVFPDSSVNTHAVFKCCSQICIGYLYGYTGSGSPL